MRNVARVSLVALKRALGVKETRLLISPGGRPGGDWRRGPLDLVRQIHQREGLFRLQLSGPLGQR